MVFSTPIRIHVQVQISSIFDLPFWSRMRPAMRHVIGEMHNNHVAPQVLPNSIIFAWHV